MKKVSPNSKSTSRRGFTRTALSALAIVPLVSLTNCTRPADNRKDRQSSPITIGGGGSVGIDVGGLGPVEHPPWTVVSKEGDTLHKLWLIDKHGGLKEIPVAPTDVVEVHCKNGSKDTIVTIYSDPLGLRFETTEFRKETPTPDSIKEVYYSGGHKIEKIQVRPASGPLPPHIDPPSGKHCTLVVVNSL